MPKSRFMFKCSKCHYPVTVKENLCSKCGERIVHPKYRHITTLAIAIIFLLGALCMVLLFFSKSGEDAAPIFCGMAGVMISSVIYLIYTIQVHRDMYTVPKE